MINFTGKLTIDSSIYKKLRYSSGKEIVEKIRPFIESENSIIDEDITLSAGLYKKGDKVIIKYGDFEESILASSKGGIDANSALNELLKLYCLKNNIKLRSSNPEVIIKGIKHYLTKTNQAEKSPSLVSNSSAHKQG